MITYHSPDVKPKIVTLLKSNSKGLRWRFSKKVCGHKNNKNACFLASELETVITFGCHFQSGYVLRERHAEPQFLFRSAILARHRRERGTKAFRQSHDLVGEELLGMGPNTRRLALFELQEQRQESLAECFACFSGEQ
jgi:hypothetical protein